MANSFICMKNLLPMYASTSESHPVFVEEINRTTQGNSAGFVPGMQMMSARKACPVIRELVETLQKRNKSNHFSNESKFVGNTAKTLREKNISLVDGRMIGIKTVKGKQILLDDLMSEDFLDLDPAAYGIQIPADEVLVRSKYQWLAYLSTEELMKTKIILAKYLKASIVDSTNECKTSEIMSVTSI